MRSTSVLLAGLLAAASVNAAECPADRAEVNALVSSLEEVKTEKDRSGAGVTREYKPDQKLHVLGVHPYEVRTQEVWDEVIRLRLDFKESPEQTRAAFLTAFPGAKCAQDSGSCEWGKSAGDLESGELEYARTQQLYEGRTVLLCDY